MLSPLPHTPSYAIVHTCCRLLSPPRLTGGLVLPPPFSSSASRLLCAAASLFLFSLIFSHPHPQPHPHGPKRAKVGVTLAHRCCHRYIYVLIYLLTSPQISLTINSISLGVDGISSGIDMISFRIDSICSDLHQYSPYHHHPLWLQWYKLPPKRPSCSLMRHHHHHSSHHHLQQRIQ